MLIFYVKFVQTDGWTMVKQYAPDLSIQGHKNLGLPKLKAFADDKLNRYSKHQGCVS